jgi:2-polyprenyl-3-methyl-5-hydroxy-6-metoxy-1,4-benzoquinol methylase
MMKYIIKIVADQYDSLLIKCYVRVRFIIININILEMIMNYIPREGKLMTLGCGFGLFECAIALLNPALEIFGYDLSESRIAQAKRVAKRLNLRNVNFFCQDVTDEGPWQKCNCILILDLLHHIPFADQERVIKRCVEMLSQNGVMIVKDIHRRNKVKLYFTWLLDMIMTKNEPVYYFDQQQMRSRMQSLHLHTLEMPINDWLPYPHILYLGFKS